MSAYLGAEEQKGEWGRAAGISRVQPCMLATQTLFPVLTWAHLGRFQAQIIVLDKYECKTGKRQILNFLAI